ncbi:MAG: MBL fold metallo-hydrolase [Planctomycetaceae bacterium]|nr:MBL fold metallo-hydrolase [Planctomycetaceae bacterium]
MALPRFPLFAQTRLVNGSTGDPVLYLDYPDRDNALLIDGGDNSALSLESLGDLTAVFITHHHIDHFIGLDRIVRANMDRDKTLSVFGPSGTIAKVADRIRSYEFPYFPFQRIVIDVYDVDSTTLRRGRLDCGRRFPPPQIEELPFDGTNLFENSTVRVETCPVDHTVPCLAFAVVEKPGWHLDLQKVDKSGLAPGPWIGEVLRHLVEPSPPEFIEIAGGRFSLPGLRDRLFKQSTGGRIAFVTDTLWSDASRENLLSLCHRADRLYCDSFYLSAQENSAKKYRHMTARHAGMLASLAKVNELVLIHFSQRYVGRYDLLVDEARAEFSRVRAEF